jgi:hypothetical protein
MSKGYVVVYFGKNWNCNGMVRNRRIVVVYFQLWKIVMVQIQITPITTHELQPVCNLLRPLRIDFTPNWFGCKPKPNQIVYFIGPRAPNLSEPKAKPKPLKPFEPKPFAGLGLRNQLAGAPVHDRSTQPACMADDHEQGASSLVVFGLWFCNIWSDSTCCLLLHLCAYMHVAVTLCGCIPINTLSAN